MIKINKIKNLLVVVLILVGSFLITQKISAATFTVDSTGDEADQADGDGLCLTSLGTCTLRAAMSQAFSIAGTDNIYFNIPTSDPGYRDYDDPDTPNSGDSAGGDDYWTIKPLTVLPHVAAVMDGATQETNQGDNNIYGPDIELNGSLTANPGAGDTHIVTFNGTNSAVNKLVFNSYTYGGGIGGYGDGFTVTRNYIGTDVKGLVRKVNGTGGIGLNQATNVIIGNDQSDGNIITATTYGIYNGCTNPNPHKISGNKFGLGADGVTALPMVTAIFLHTNCNSIIGGDTSAERNYIASTTSIGIRFEGYPNATTAVHQIYNNYIGTDINGNINNSIRVQDAAISDIFGGDYNGYKTINIGAAGKGNLIANSKYGVRLNVPKSIVTISNNTFAKVSYGIYGYKYGYPNPDTNATIYADVNILNNYIGDYANPDPYFGLTFTKSDWTCTDCTTQNYFNKYGVYIEGFNGTIKGNQFTGNAYNAIWVDTYTGISTDSVVGGQNALTGSLCQGLEKNCVEGNGTEPLDGNLGGGIVYVFAKPSNMDTIYADNYFGSGNGYDQNKNVTILTGGVFELLSGTVRRTDIPEFSLTLPAPTTADIYDGWSGYYNDGTPGPTLEFMNYKLNCSNVLYCPASGTSSGENGKMVAFISKIGYEGYDPNWYPWLTDLNAYNYIVDINIDNNGNIQRPNIVKYDLNHFASKQFSFDADSTTDPQDYPGISEPWTDDPNATSADSYSSYPYSSVSTLGIKQILKLQYVDANPIRQEDGSYIIYVDSTSDEDNVSTCGYDDGYGDYSGGGCGGVDGLPDGKTSLREAMIVANQGISPLKIEFNIPTTDSGYLDFDTQNSASSGDSADGDDFFLIQLTGSLPDITLFKDVTIDGSSQEVNSGANRNTFGPDIQISGGVGISNVFKTFTDESTKSLLDLTIKGLIINNSTGNLIETNVNYGSEAGSESLSLIDNYLCTDAKGLDLSSTCATGVIRSSAINGNLTITNNVVGWSNSSTSYVAIRVTAPVNTTQLLINNNKIGTSVDGTELTKAVDGYGIMVDATSTNTNVLVQNNIINTTEGTCIFARGKLTLDGNYCGTDITGNQILTTSEIYMEGTTTAINNVAARIIGLEGSGGITVSVTDNIIGANKNKTQKFDLSRFINAGQTAPASDNIAAFETWGGVEELSNNYISSTHNGVYVKDLIYPNTMNVENNTFNDIVGNAIRMKGQIGLKLANNIFTNISGAQIIDLLVNNNPGVDVNDSLDADNFTNDLAANDGMNSPVIEKVTYLGGSKYKFEGLLSNNQSGESPFDLELCSSNSTKATCIQTLFYEQDYIQLNNSGENNWDLEVTIPDTDGSNPLAFTTLATNSLSSTSEFGNVFTTEDPNYFIKKYPITLTSPTNNQDLTLRTPLLQWETSTDPDIKQYNIYINDAFYASVSKTENKLQIPSSIPLGKYNWYVVGVRNNNTEGGRSLVWSFNINLESITESNNTPTSYPTLVAISEVPSYPIDTTIFENNVVNDLSVTDKEAKDESFFVLVKNLEEIIPVALPLLLTLALGAGTVYTSGISLSQIGIIFGYKNKKKLRDDELFEEPSKAFKTLNLLFKLATALGFIYALLVQAANPSLGNLLILVSYPIIFGINTFIKYKGLIS